MVVNLNVLNLNGSVITCNSVKAFKNVLDLYYTPPPPPPRTHGRTFPPAKRHTFRGIFDIGLILQCSFCKLLTQKALLLSHNSAYAMGAIYYTSHESTVFPVLIS